jgi:predicted DCC family thiol-disulfide oxidoreductase YuxK
MKHNLLNGKNILKIMSNNQHGIVLFDGVCNLCNASVQFILKRDKKAYYRFASLQSDAGRDLLKKYNLPAEGINSIVVIEKDKVYQRSTGALRIARKLSGGWFLLYAFIIIPAFIRNAVYSWVANNRYRWFGKKEECMLPLPEWKGRFIG